MKVCLYHKGVPHQLNAMSALAKGLVRHGHTPRVTDTYDIGVVCVVWGAKNAPPEGMYDNVLYVEAGYINGQSGDYIRDRLRFVSTAWNGFHGRGDPVPDRPPDRWKALGLELKPWRWKGDLILICANHPGDQVNVGADWKAIESDTLKLAGRLKVKAIFRHHPIVAPNQSPLSDALVQACRVVTWCSTSAVEALIEGIPTVALDEGSIAWPVCSHTVCELPYRGPREQWAYNLAYKQWTLDELADGSAWEVLKHGISTSHVTENSAGLA